MVEAGGMKQKIPDRDRPRRRVRCGAWLSGHHDILEFGDERGDSVVKSEAAKSTTATKTAAKSATKTAAKSTKPRGTGSSS